MLLRRGKQWTHLSSFALFSVNNDAMRMVDDGGDCGGYCCWWMMVGTAVATTAGYLLQYYQAHVLVVYDRSGVWLRMSCAVGCAVPAVGPTAVWWLYVVLRLDLHLGPGVHGAGGAGCIYEHRHPM
jgi:hypothetical protein